MKDISLSLILKVVLRKIWIILLAAVIVGAGTFFYCSNFVDPTYAAASSVIVTNGGLISDDDSTASSGKVSNTDVAASINILETCVDIMKTNSFYKEVANHPEIKRLGYSSSELDRMTSIERRSDYSLFIDIKVNCGDDKEAIVIADCVAETAPKYIQKIIANTRVEVEPSSGSALVAPMTTRTAVIAALLAAVVAVAIFVILAATDNTIKGEEDILKK